MTSPFLILEVEGSHHYAVTCPCGKCQDIRQRLDLPSPPLGVTCEAAYLMGLIPSLPAKSLARQVADEHRNKPKAL